MTHPTDDATGSAIPATKHLTLAREQLGIDVPEDATPYEDWVRSVHEGLPGLEGSTAAAFPEIESEVLQALAPLTEEEINEPREPDLLPNLVINEGDPLCLFGEPAFACADPAAQIAYALCNASWQTHEDPNAIIHAGSDGNTTVWAIGLLTPPGPSSGQKRRLAFDFTAPLCSLSCASKDELVALWATVSAIVGPPLPVPEVRIWCNFSAYDDPENLAQNARRRADLAAAATRHGLHLDSYSNGDDYIETYAEGEEHLAIAALRELVANPLGHDPFTVDLQQELTLSRFWRLYGPDGECLTDAAEVESF